MNPSGKSRKSGFVADDRTAKIVEPVMGAFDFETSTISVAPLPHHRSPQKSLTFWGEVKVYLASTRRWNRPIWHLRPFIAPTNQRRTATYCDF